MIRNCNPTFIGDMIRCLKRSCFGTYQAIIDQKKNLQILNYWNAKKIG